MLAELPHGIGDGRSGASPGRRALGLYPSFWSASPPNRVYNVVQLAQDGLISTVVIDVKDVMGRDGFDSNVPQVVECRSRERIISDLGALVRKLHAGGLHVVARMVTFNDPMLARARPDLAVHSKALLDEIAPQFSTHRDALARRAWLAVGRSGVARSLGLQHRNRQGRAVRGVDEVNFDYIRFPSGGSLSDMHLPVTTEDGPKRDVIVRFFKHLREQFPAARLSADLFGLVTVAGDHLGIGQVIEDALPYFDALCPMVSPSCYAEGF